MTIDQIGIIEQPYSSEGILDPFSDLLESIPSYECGAFSETEVYLWMDYIVMYFCDIEKKKKMCVYETRSQLIGHFGARLIHM